MKKMTEVPFLQMFVYFERGHYISCTTFPIHQMWPSSHINVCDTTAKCDTSLLRNVWSINLFPTLCSEKTVSDCPLQWEMSFRGRSNMKPFPLFWCTPLSQTSSKTTPWWCVAISYCVDARTLQVLRVDDRTLQVLHPYCPPWFGYHSNI